MIRMNAAASGECSLLFQAAPFVSRAAEQWLFWSRDAGDGQQDKLQLKAQGLYKPLRYANSTVILTTRWGASLLQTHYSWLHHAIWWLLSGEENSLSFFLASDTHIF